MADDPNSDDKTPTPTPPAPPSGEQGGDSPPFSQDAEGNWVDADGNRIYFKQEFDSGMAAARKDGEKRAQRSAPRTPPAPTPKPKSTPKATEPSSGSQPDYEELNARIAQMELRRQYDRLALEKRLPADKADLLFDLVTAKQPEDMGDFLEQAMKTFGITSETTTQPKPAASPDPVKPPQPPAPPKAPTDPLNAPPAPPQEPPKPERDPVAPPKSPPTDNGTPRKVDPLAEGGVIDVLSLSAEDIERMGIDRVVAEFEKAVSAHRVSQGAPPRPRALRARK